MRRAVFGCVFSVVFALILSVEIEPFSHASGTPQKAAQKPSEKEAVEQRQFTSQVDAYLQPFLQGRNFTGAVLIARRGKVLVSKGYRMANDELKIPNTSRTKFHIASVSKPFTAAAILILQERGDLGPDQTLSRFIPDYPNGDRITLRHLLTHTSGIPNLNDFPDYDEKSRFPHTAADLVEMFKSKPLDFQPGERYRYSNSNYALLADIIEKVSGKSYGDFLRENIFTPLGMNDTGHDGRAAALIENRASGYVPAGFDGLENAPYLDWSSKTGNGSLYSTVEDLYKFDRALYTEKLLKKATLAKIFGEHTGNQFGWFVRKRFGHRVAASNGRSPGFTASFERFIDDDTCVIVLSNSYATTAQSPIAEDLAAMALGENVPARPPLKPAKVAARSLDALAGRYEFGEDFYRPKAQVTVRREDDHLVMDWGQNYETLLVPISETEFLDRLFWARAVFEKDPQGRVSGILWRAERDFQAKKLPEQ